MGMHAEFGTERGKVEEKKQISNSRFQISKLSARGFLYFRGNDMRLLYKHVIKSEKFEIKLALVNLRFLI
jgi:hypothetical protein